METPSSAWNWQSIFPTNGVPDASGACRPISPGVGGTCLPATPDDRVALAHQESVAWIKGAVGSRGRALLKFDMAVLRPRLTTSNNRRRFPRSGESMCSIEMGRKAYLTGGITWCEFDVRNGGVAGLKRIDYKVDHTYEPLIRTNIPKRSALQKRADV